MKSTNPRLRDRRLMRRHTSYAMKEAAVGTGNLVVGARSAICFYFDAPGPGGPNDVSRAPVTARAFMTGGAVGCGAALAVWFKGSHGLKFRQSVPSHCLP